MCSRRLNRRSRTGRQVANYSGFPVRSVLSDTVRRLPAHGNAETNRDQTISTKRRIANRAVITE